MSERVPAAIAAASSIVILFYACATAPTTTTTPGNAQPVAAGPGPSRAAGAQRVPLTDSARRVRDSITAVRRDSAVFRCSKCSVPFS